MAEHIRRRGDRRVAPPPYVLGFRTDAKSGHWEDGLNLGERGMSESAERGRSAASIPCLVEDTELIGEYKRSGFREPVSPRAPSRRPGHTVVPPALPGRCGGSERIAL